MAVVMGRKAILRRRQKHYRLVKDTHAMKTTWHLFDATGQRPGRIAMSIAYLLSGKHKPTQRSHIDVGDSVVVVNCEKVEWSKKKKWKTKIYRHHTGYIGNLKEIPAWRVREQHPERIIARAVKGMLPRNAHKTTRLRRLKIYKGPVHPHTQLPQIPEARSADMQKALEEVLPLPQDMEPDLITDAELEEQWRHLMTPEQYAQVKAWRQKRKEFWGYDINELPKGLPKLKALKHAPKSLQGGEFDRDPRNKKK